MNVDLVSKHIDKGELITVLFHVGQPLRKGATYYYTSLISDAYRKKAKYIPNEHGRFTIRCFDNIIHNDKAWERSHGCINFNLKKSFEHFVR